MFWLSISKYCVESFQLPSLCDPLFSRIWTEYRDLQRKYPYSVWTPENIELKKTPYLDTFHKLKFLLCRKINTNTKKCKALNRTIRKSRKLQKSQFCNSLVNCGHFGSTAEVCIKKSNFPSFPSLELKKIKKCSQSNIQKSQNLFVNWEKTGRFGSRDEMDKVTF